MWIWWLCADGDLVFFGWQTRAVAQAVSDKDFERAMSLRDPEFCESLEGFIATSTLEKEKKLPENKVSKKSEADTLLLTITFQRIRVAIMQ